MGRGRIVLESNNMKRVLVFIASAVMMLSAVSANAQSLSTIFGAAKAAASSAVSQATGVSESTASGIFDAVSKAVYAYTGKTDAVSLPGSWSYLGSAIALEGEGTVSALAGTAVSSQIESKINETLTKFGFTAGSVSFVFNEDLTFTCTFRGVPLSGRWKTLNEGASVQLQFGQTMKYLSMTGSLTKTIEGCEMLFDATKFLTFLKTALSMAGQSSSVSALSSLANGYKGMKIGFELKKN